VSVYSAAAAVVSDSVVILNATQFNVIAALADVPVTASTHILSIIAGFFIFIDNELKD
jgi:hypothetical protein